jgi:NADH-quinone oxidoreductase subunit J
VAADQIAFWVFAPISVGSAIAMVLQRNAVHAALFLVVNFFTIAVFYLVLGASFLFAVQIIVYAGAIMVLFLFVIMLLGVDQDESLLERLRGQRVIAVTLGVGIAVELIVAIRAGIGFATKGAENFDTVANKGGNAVALSRVLFRQYFFPFEVTSVLLIIAAVAVVVLASRHRRAITRAEQESGLAAARQSEPVP